MEKLQTHVHPKHETKALQNVAGTKKAEKPTPVAAQ